MVVDKNQKNDKSPIWSDQYYILFILFILFISFISFISYCSIDEHLKNPLAYHHPQLVYLMC